jgi:hypothetical protein
VSRTSMRPGPAAHSPTSRLRKSLGETLISSSRDDRVRIPSDHQCESGGEPMLEHPRA